MDPRSRRISARWTRQRPCTLPIAWPCRQCSMARVHSSAKSYCARACSAHTTSQYTTPVEKGSNSPVTVVIAASFSCSRPPATSPSRIRFRASAIRPIAAAPASQREPIWIALRAHRRAVGKSPERSLSYVRTTASLACTAVSSLSSRYRSACLIHPRTGAMSAVSKSKCIATRVAALAASADLFAAALRT